MSTKAVLSNLVVPAVACFCTLSVASYTPTASARPVESAYQQISRNLPYFSSYNGVTITLGDNAMESIALQANLKKLKSFEAYADNWNGYGAPRFEKSLVSLAENVLRKLDHQPEVFPIAGGAIQLEYEKESGEYLEFEILENEDAHCLSVDKDGKEREFDVALDQINKVVNDFYGHSVLRN